MALLLLLVSLALGAFAGWLAGITSRSGGITVPGNVVLGMLGGVGVGAVAMEARANAFLTPFLVLFVVFVGGMLVFAGIGMLRRSHREKVE